MITKKTIKKFNEDGFIIVKNFVQKKKNKLNL